MRGSLLVLQGMLDKKFLKLQNPTRNPNKKQKLLFMSQTFSTIRLQKQKIPVAANRANTVTRTRVAST